MRIFPDNNVSPLWRYIRAVIRGIGCFFPGSLFSLPFTMLWANGGRPGDDHTMLAAIWVSLLIGVLSIPVAWIFLFWNVARKPKCPPQD